MKLHSDSFLRMISSTTDANYVKIVRCIIKVSHFLHENNTEDRICRNVYDLSPYHISQIYLQCSSIWKMNVAFTWLQCYFTSYRKYLKRVFFLGGRSMTKQNFKNLYSVALMSLSLHKSHRRHVCITDNRKLNCIQVKNLRSLSTLLQKVFTSGGTIITPFSAGPSSFVRRRMYKFYYGTLLVKV
jgi:hypothetical protein